MYTNENMIVLNKQLKINENICPDVARPCHGLGVLREKGIYIFGKTVHLVIMHRRKRHTSEGETDVVPPFTDSGGIGIAQCFQVEICRHGILGSLAVDDILCPLFATRDRFVHLHHLRIAVSVLEIGRAHV